ncbi:hypothetical protein AB1Y20_009260 [Prymnesium parvum]|uniref:Uncharacterized protein n=1 Tax=Prymnesium parvum TaxID=97485 RepID=A0AB34K1N5_PRYPA
MNRLAYSLMHNPDVQTPSSSPPKGSKKTRRATNMYDGNIVAHTCYDKHSASPLWMPKGRATTGGAKRRRASADDFELDVEEDCEDCELEDEEMAVDSD